MAKQKRKRSHPSKNQQKYAKRNKTGFWIDKCRESSSCDASLSLILTQVNLTDVEGQSTTESISKNTIHTQQEERLSNNKNNDDADDDVAPRKLESKTDLETVHPAPETNIHDAADPACPPVTAAGTTGEEITTETVQTTSISNAGPTRTSLLSIRRAPSAKQRPPKFTKTYFQPLPNGDCGDGIVNPHSDVVEDKYWAQRKRLFDRFDQGIQLDAESWFSVTPQAIANHIADRVVRACNARTNLVVLDAFCGCGGNAIAFAKRDEVSMVVCVDLDRKKLEMAAHNASLYDVPKHKLVFVTDNALTILDEFGKQRTSTDDDSGESLRKPSMLGGYRLNGNLPDIVDCVFLSPPWGGMDYGKVGKAHYTLTNNIQIAGGGLDDALLVNGEELLERSARVQKRIVYFLPRNINGIALGQSAIKAGYSSSEQLSEGAVELEKNVLMDKFKTVTAYFGFPLLPKDLSD